MFEFDAVYAYLFGVVVRCDKFCYQCVGEHGKVRPISNGEQVCLMTSGWYKFVTECDKKLTLAEVVLDPVIGSRVDNDLNVPVV